MSDQASTIGGAPDSRNGAPGSLTPSQAVPGLATPDPRSATRSRWTSLPMDVMRGVRERVAVFALAVAGIWVIVLVLGDVVAPLLGHHHMTNMGWPMPGTLTAGIGIAASIALWLHARRTSCLGHGLINAALAFQIASAALVAYQANFHSDMNTGRISWLVLVILVTPAIVPTPPLKTLVVSLVIATMDPITVWISSMRAPIHWDTYLAIWYFMPNYISVGLALIPSTLISGLGRRVHEARDLGSYQLGERIGRGGMGEVYRARHRMLARPAAIKLIRPEALGGNGDGSNIMVRRFHREAQAAASLRSPHTISLYDFGVTEEGTFYYVMELLDGFDLETLVRRFGPIPPERAIALLRQACRSLGEAHARGLVHRDIKPSNIFTCRLGLNVDFGKVLDFGLVKMARAHGETLAESALLTQPDITTGTPAFMSPEMALGDGEVDRRADIYALGCVGYWLVTGKLVFEAETPVKMMLRHIQSPPEPPSKVSELDIPEALDQVILQCLAKDPDHRPNDAIALACALDAVPVRERWTQRRAEEWWDVHSPAPTPMTELRAPTPMAMMHAEPGPKRPAD